MKASGGLDERDGVTWYRPIPPPGYAVAGDVVRPYLAASPRFYLEPPVFAIGPFPPGAAMADKKRSSTTGTRAKREVLPRQPVNYLAKPVDFEVVWRHEGGVRGMLRCTVWRPVPPPSFVAVGCIITLTHNKPSPDCVVCLHESLVVPAEVDALLWTASASPASAAATNKKDRTLTRAKSERDVTAHTTATFLFGDAEEVYGKSTSDGVVVCSVKPKEGDDEPGIAIGCSLALPVPAATDGLMPPALTGAAYCLRRSVVTHAVHNAGSYSFTSAGASPTAARTIPSAPTTTSTSLPASPVSSLPASPSSSFSIPPSLSSSPSSSSSPASSANVQRPLSYQASAAEMSPRRLRSASNPPRSPSHSNLASASSAFAASSTTASLRSHRSASHATSPPRSSKRVTHMLDRPAIAGYSITFVPPSPSLPSVKATSRSSPPSSSSTPARPSYRISSLVPPSPSSSSSSLSTPSVSLSSSSLLPSWHLPRLSTQATLLPSSSMSSLHSSALYPHTSLSSPPSLVAAASDRRYTMAAGAAGDEYECPRCHGHKGQGPFGPCPLGSIHFTHMCELCEGKGSVAGPSELCRLCEGEGGFGEFGKCRPESLHFRACVKCHGRGFLSARGHSS